MTSSTGRPWLAYAALATGVVCIAWSALFVSWAHIPGPASALYRVLVAAVILVPWRAAHRKHGLPARRAALLAIAAGAFFALDLALFQTAVIRTSAATATLLGNNAPLLVALGTWTVFGERPERGFWAGLVLALVGCIIIIAPDLLHGTHGDPLGDVMAATASIFFAAYLITNERVRAGMDTLTFTTLAIVGSVLTLIVACVVLRVPLGGYSLRSWAALLGLGLVSQLGGYLAITYALGHLPATVTAVGLLAQAPLTALLAIPLLGEPLSPAQIVGGVLVLVGIFVVNRRDRAASEAMASGV